MPALNPKVDAFIAREKAWHAEYAALRKVILSCPLTEELKWGQPCYTHEGANVVLMHGFKEYFALLFMKGSLLKDPKKLLIQQTENVQSGRQIRFSKASEISAMKKTLKAYILQAIEVEKSGLKVELKKTSDFRVPVEFRKKLAKDPELEAAFQGLTPGRQRAYLLYFGAAKQSATREARIDKAAPQILKGKGLHD